MTDLISKLADDLIALINASPRSPTKEEIKQVLRSRALPQAIADVTRMMSDAQAVGSYSYGGVPVIFDSPSDNTVVSEYEDGTITSGSASSCLRTVIVGGEKLEAGDLVQVQIVGGFPTALKLDDNCGLKAALSEDLDFEESQGRLCAKYGHVWTARSYDQHGLLCQPGTFGALRERDHYRCPCGATKPIDAK